MHGTSWHYCRAPLRLHSSGKRNLENDQELTVRTGITHVLNLANDVILGIQDLKRAERERGR